MIDESPQQEAYLLSKEINRCLTELVQLPPVVLEQAAEILQLFSEDYYD